MKIFFLFSSQNLTVEILITCPLNVTFMSTVGSIKNVKKVNKHTYSCVQVQQNLVTHN